MPLDDRFGILFLIRLCTSQPSRLDERRRLVNNLFKIFQRNTKVSFLAFVRDLQVCKCL